MSAAGLIGGQEVQVPTWHVDAACIGRTPKSGHRSDAIGKCELTLMFRCRDK